MTAPAYPQISLPQQARRELKHLFVVRFNPDRHTLVSLLSYLAVAGALYLAFQVFTTSRVAANFITFGPVTLAGLGVALPVFYTLRIRRRPLSDLGITSRWAWASLALGLLLGLETYRSTLASLPVAWSAAQFPLVVMALAVGLFEAVFFRGWLQLRFEQAFGALPALGLGALAYAFYHLGYGMDLNEIVFLFGLGLVFGAVFRLTRNILVLWPFYTPVGGLYTTLSDGLTMPFEAAYGFVLTLALMGAVFAAGWALSRKVQGAA